MIFDFLTIFFLLAGSLLLLRLIGQRRHALSAVVIEETHELGQPATATAPGFGGGNSYSENVTAILGTAPGNSTKPIIRRPADGMRSNEEASHHLLETEFNRSRLNSLLEAIASISVRDDIQDNRCTIETDTPTATANGGSQVEPSNPVTEDTHNAALQEISAETQDNATERRNTITSADGDLAEMISRLASDTEFSSQD